jgi:hypothetical protein
MSIAFCVLMISLPTASLEVERPPERHSACVTITKDGCFCSENHCSAGLPLIPARWGVESWCEKGGGTRLDELPKQRQPPILICRGIANALIDCRLVMGSKATEIS